LLFGGEKPAHVQGPSADFDPLTDRVADAGERVEGQAQEPILGPPRIGRRVSRGRSVPHGPAPPGVNSFIARVDAQDDRGSPVVGEIPEARPSRLEAEPAMMIDRKSLAFVHGEPFFPFEALGAFEALDVELGVGLAVELVCR